MGTQVGGEAESTKVPGGEGTGVSGIPLGEGEYTGFKIRSCQGKQGGENSKGSGLKGPGTWVPKELGGMALSGSEGDSGFWGRGAQQSQGREIKIRRGSAEEPTHGGFGAGLRGINAPGRGSEDGASLIPQDPEAQGLRGRGVKGQASDQRSKRGYGAVDGLKRGAGGQGASHGSMGSPKGRVRAEGDDAGKLVMSSTKPPLLELDQASKAMSRTERHGREQGSQKVGQRQLIGRGPGGIKGSGRMGVSWASKPSKCGKCGDLSSMILTLPCGRHVCLCSACGQDFMLFLGERIQALRKGHTEGHSSMAGGYASIAGGLTTEGSLMAPGPLPILRKSDVEMPPIQQHHPGLRSGNAGVRSTIPQLEDLHRVLPLLNRGDLPARSEQARLQKLQVGAPLSSSVPNLSFNRPGPEIAYAASFGLGKKLSRHTPLKKIINPGSPDSQSPGRQRHARGGTRPVKEKEVCGAGEEKGYWTEPTMEREESGSSLDLHDHIAGKLRRKAGSLGSKVDLKTKDSGVGANAQHSNPLTQASKPNPASRAPDFPKTIELPIIDKHRKTGMDGRSKVKASTLPAHGSKAREPPEEDIEGWSETEEDENQQGTEEASRTPLPAKKAKKGRGKKKKTVRRTHSS